MDLALIGNGSYQALVDSQARLQWLCWPRFDSSFVVGALLDPEKGGEFSVAPVGTGFGAKQRYLDDTPILETVFSSAEESMSVTDFAPRFRSGDALQRPRRLVRRLRPLKGTPRVRYLARLVSDYGRKSGAPDLVRIEQSLPLQSGDEFVLDQDIYLVLSWDQPVGAVLPAQCEAQLADTASYWRQWTSSLVLPPRYTPAVIRSAITLKLHQYEDTGALTAAATTSLPEHAGSGRNWDYRFCWPRDSYFSVDALHKLGSEEESVRYAEFLLQIASESDSFQPLYGIGGETDVEEEILEHLAGYRGEQPVRIGNQAYVQEQHDIYGEMICALEPVYRASQDSETRSLLMRLADDIDANFDKPDAGLWEKRNAPARHSFSVLMHWMGGVALHRLGEALGDAELAGRGNSLRNRARECLDQECWNEEEGLYAEIVGGRYADASLLFMLSVGYFSANDPRATSHLQVLREKLQGPEGFFRRYVHDDGLGETLSSFTVCTLWYAEALAWRGHKAEASALLEAVLASCNHLGLLSEDIDPSDLTLWGNFPQTYSHVGIIRCALALSSS